MNKKYLMVNLAEGCVKLYLKSLNWKQKWRQLDITCHDKPDITFEIKNSQKVQKQHIWRSQNRIILNHVNYLGMILTVSVVNKSFMHQLTGLQILWIMVHSDTS
jgi:hypothetical protein